MNIIIIYWVTTYSPTTYYLDLLRVVSRQKQYTGKAEGETIAGLYRSSEYLFSSHDDDFK